MIVNPKKPRLLVLTSTFPRFRGDKEPPFVYELCKRLSDDFQITVLAPHCPGARRCERFDSLAVIRYRYFIKPYQVLAYDGGISDRLKRFPWLYSLVPFFLLGQCVALLYLLRRFRFQTIHAHWLIPQGLVTAICLKFSSYRPYVVLTSHGGDLYGLRGRILSALKRWIVHKSDAVTVVNQPMLDELQQWPAPTLHLVPMGVDSQKIFLPDKSQPREPATLLYIGRLSRKKGVEYLLEALPSVLESYPQCSLWVVGTGTEENRLKRKSKRLQIANHVKFLGRVSNTQLPTFYRGATILVAPSITTDDGDREGLSVVLSEAMACECPVVTTSQPGVEYLIEHNRTGLLVAEKDSGQLAAAIVNLLDNPEQRQALGIAGRKKVESTMDWAIIAKKYADILYPNPPDPN